MLRLATDADVNGKLVRALRRRRRDIDLERVLDHLPESAADPDVLEWAAAHNRVLISNDRNTMVKHAWERVIRKKMRLPGLIVTTNAQPIRAALDDILLIAECMSPEEIADQVVIYLPLR